MYGSKFLNGDKSRVSLTGRLLRRNGVPSLAGTAMFFTDNQLPPQLHQVDAGARQARPIEELGMTVLAVIV